MVFIATLLAAIGIVSEMLHIAEVFSLLFFMCVFVLYCLVINLLAQARSNQIYLK